MNWLVAAQIPIIILGLWIFTAYMSTSFPTLINKRICLLIAHPDDEAMFFAPSLLWLTRPELGNSVVILCLSSGDADGLGYIRRGELVKSALHLGVRSKDAVVVLDDANFPDSMTKTWDEKLVAATLTKYFVPKKAATTGSKSAPPLVDVDVIVTFDRKGITNHPNHISCYNGAIAFVKTLMQRHAGWESPVKLYTLTTTNVARKFSSVIDAILTIALTLGRAKDRGEYPTPLLIVNKPWELLKAQEAMTSAHKSQMVWFRWIYISVSRYMIMNDLVRQKV